MVSISSCADWFDGLHTFMRYICHKNWLGGWFMPQKRSYFALQLPKGWWVFGLDLALHGDIDVYQFRFFAELCQNKVFFFCYGSPIFLLLVLFCKVGYCQVIRSLQVELDNIRYKIPVLVTMGWPASKLKSYPIWKHYFLGLHCHLNAILSVTEVIKLKMVHLLVKSC